MRFDFASMEFIETELDPSRLAIAATDRDLSWAELKKLSDQLCEKLSSTGIPQGCPVIIYGQKEHLFQAAVLSCMRLKLPYIPIDRVMPPERIKRIVEISGAQLLICSGEEIPRDRFPFIITNKLEVVSSGKCNWQRLPVDSTDPVAYVMFTSGSTGEPKGVMITHSAAKSFANWFVSNASITPDTVFMNQAIFSFDLSLLDTCGTFAGGAAMVLNDQLIVKDQEAFLQRIKSYGCNFWNSTPSFVYLFLNNPGFTEKNLPALKKFLFIGEELPARTVKKLQHLFPGAIIYNSYGPTEATVAITLLEITPEHCSSYEKSLPIELTGSHSAVFFDENSPDPSEILIAGPQVSIGYLKNPELTAQKFFTWKNQRAYRTGDHGYYKDGYLFFTGRTDDQVKLNGYRIELGDISGVLLKLENILDAVTIPMKSAGKVKKLVSFVRLKKPVTDQNVFRKELIQKLKAHLPAYMIPGDVVIMDEFPVNANHKTDKGKLAEIYKHQL